MVTRNDKNDAFSGIMDDTRTPRAVPKGLHSPHGTINIENLDRINDESHLSGPSTAPHDVKSVGVASKTVTQNLWRNHASSADSR